MVAARRRIKWRPLSLSALLLKFLSSPGYLYIVPSLSINGISGLSMLWLWSYSLLGRCHRTSLYLEFVDIAPQPAWHLKFKLIYTHMSGRKLLPKRDKVVSIINQSWLTLCICCWFSPSRERSQSFGWHIVLFWFPRSTKKCAHPSLAGVTIGVRLQLTPLDATAFSVVYSIVVLSLLTVEVST